MRRNVHVSCAAVFVVAAGCAVPSTSRDAAPAAGAGMVAAGRADQCPVSTPTIWRPPDAPGRDPLPQDPYFRSPDGRLSTVNQQFWHTGGMKVLWLKPVGSRLEVSGHRLDGAAPPLRAALHGPNAYPGDFEASGVYFPTVGCWEVEARADGSVLRFVVAVT